MIINLTETVRIEVDEFVRNFTVQRCRVVRKFRGRETIHTGRTRWTDCGYHGTLPQALLSAAKFIAADDGEEADATVMQAIARYDRAAERIIEVASELAHALRRSTASAPTGGTAGDRRMSSEARSLPRCGPANGRTLFVTPGGE